jgi:hypothetical protein
MAPYNGTTAERHYVADAKVWKHLLKLFHSKNVSRMNELNGVVREMKYPDKWFTNLFFLH